MTEPDLAGGSAAAAPSRAVRWVGLGVVPLLLVVLLLVAAEGAVRLRQWSKHGTAGSLAALYRTDEAIALRVLEPGARVGAISINRAGFRGPEIDQPKPAGTVRVAFLGASTTFCAEVSGDAAVWPQLVAEALRKRFPGTRFDFVNGGVPGYTVAASRQNLQHKVAPLEPDVIVVYHATNDLTGDVNALARAAGIADPRPGAFSSWLGRHSLLWELVEKNLRVMAAQREDPAAATRKLQVKGEQLGGEFRTQMGALLREAGATGARVAVATFATHLRPGQSAEAQKRASVSALVYMPFMPLDGLLAGYERYNALITDAAQAEGALLIGGEDRIPADPTHFVDTVHFTDLGSRAMADRVVDALAADAGVRALAERHRR